MRDYLNIGSSPSGESCAQVGTDNYYEESVKECRAFMHQLERVFPDIPDGSYFTVKTFPHDFGSYREVVIVYDDEDEQAQEFAYNVENNTPEFWDDEAKKELKETSKCG